MVLTAISAALKEASRTSDVIYRYGGEEFLCILPEQTLETGFQACERMRAFVEHLAIPSPARLPGVMTISAGVAVLASGSADSAQAVLKEADEALYRAKQQGRNCVVCGSLTPQVAAAG